MHLKYQGLNVAIVKNRCWVSLKAELCFGVPAYGPFSLRERGEGRKEVK